MEVICEEECCTVLKPLPMMTGRDGRDYSPMQAIGHVLGLEKQTVDTAVATVRNAASVLSEKTQTARINLATALEGEECCDMLPCMMLCITMPGHGKHAH